MSPRMSVSKRAACVTAALKSAFPDAECSLDNDLPERLAIRGILSAQCTDKRVNMTAVDLFDRYPAMELLAAADPADVAMIIKPCGLTASKTASVMDFANKFCNEWGNEVPSDIDKLMTCKGVGKKIANLIAGEIYGIPMIVVDTHCKRVMYRIGLTDNTDPLKIEKDLDKVIPDEDKIAIGHLAVELGRTYCNARNPLCGECPVAECCRKRV
ncbi:MAG: endonuclease III [Saccharofermentans sp.]|nr:endonuclease III [Saccharofermentans sp.]